MKKIVFILGMMTILIGGFVWLKIFSKNSLPSGSRLEQSVLPSDGEFSQATVIAENLETPWSIVFLLDDSLLVTERPGRVRLIDSNGQLQAEPVAILKSVQEIGEGGLLGITLHPDFSTNNYVYLYYTYSGSGDDTFNRVVRMTYQNKQLKDEQIIVDKIPGSSNHNGGRIKFGPDGFLYIATGDAENPSQAQDINALGGKILRVTDEGQPVSNSPFNNLVYSYGHRNPQGLAWDNEGRLWAPEHGRSGVLSGLDELNLIEKGKNYGWPTIQGDGTKTGMETPKLHSGSSITWAPAGATFIKNSLFFGGLRGQALYEAIINGDKITLKEHFKGQFGRIRDVVLGPDNLLYITTSNKDGRGNPTESDDKIIKIDPKKL
jgi:glucose/arabinose dehydrogenase